MKASSGTSVLAAKEQTGRRNEAEARVVLRVSQDNHTRGIDLAASLKSFADKT